MIKLDNNFKQWLVETRREFHRFPELMLEETRTTATIIEKLSEMGIQAEGFDDMTGATALIQGAKPGKTIALRADIDALPVQELAKLPYASQYPGIMHACGHDAHTTIMLGTAKYIVESGIVDNLQGNVKLIFQPAEEGDGGAETMIRRGVLDNPHVDAVLACHLQPDLEVKTAGIYRSQSHASTDPFDLTITGRGGHGARPNETIDPIAAGAYFLNMVQSVISRNIDPLETAVIHIGTFVSGNARNTVPDEARLTGTIRVLEPELRGTIKKRLKEMVRGVESAFGVTCRLDFHKGYPACINDTQLSEFLGDMGRLVLGQSNIKYLRPSTGGEDFAYFAEARPGAMIRLGCGNRSKGIIHPLHSPYFEMDEDVLGIGVEIFTQAVCNYLK